MVNLRLYCPDCDHLLSQHEPEGMECQVRGCVICTNLQLVDTVPEACSNECPICHSPPGKFCGRDRGSNEPWIHQARQEMV